MILVTTNVTITRFNSNIVACSLMENPGFVPTGKYPRRNICNLLHHMLHKTIYYDIAIGMYEDCTNLCYNLPYEMFLFPFQSCCGYGVVNVKILISSYRICTNFSKIS